MEDDIIVKMGESLLTSKYDEDYIDERVENEIMKVMSSDDVFKFETLRKYEDGVRYFFEKNLFVIEFLNKWLGNEEVEGISQEVNEKLNDIENFDEISIKALEGAKEVLMKVELMSEAVGKDNVVEFLSLIVEMGQQDMEVMYDYDDVDNDTMYA